MKFSIKNLARIKEAEIEIKPLTIFTGQNGVNKSYLAHVVYELNNFKIDQNIFEEIIKNIPDKQEILNYIEKFKTKEIEENIEFDIEEDIIINKKIYINMKKNQSLNQILKIIKTALTKEITRHINKTFNTNTALLDHLTLSFPEISEITIDILQTKNQTENEKILINKFILAIINKFLSDIKIAKKTFYFPASRTGFVLAFDEIVSGLFRDKLGGVPTNTKLTKPTKEFLLNFADIKIGKFEDDNEWLLFNKKKDNNISKLIEFIEKNIIHGKIEEKRESSYTKYYLNTNYKELELHVTSSATVELLPIVIFLKHFITIKDKLLIIEEPEAHLHPKAQILMGRLIALMVNYGIKVLIISHSDYIIAELNNLIKANYVSKEKQTELNLNNFTLDINKVSAYLFKENNKKDIKVKKLEIDEYGISQENFEEIMDEISQRSLLLNEWIQEK